MESLLPSKPTLDIPNGINVDEASPMIDHKKESFSSKHRSQRPMDESNEDDDDDENYIDADDDDEDDEHGDGHPQVHTCQTH